MANEITGPIQYAVQFTQEGGPIDVLGINTNILYGQHHPEVIEDPTLVVDFPGPLRRDPQMTNPGPDWPWEKVPLYSATLAGYAEGDCTDVQRLPDPDGGNPPILVLTDGEGEEPLHRLTPFGGRRLATAAFDPSMQPKLILVDGTSVDWSAGADGTNWGSNPDPNAGGS